MTLSSRPWKQGFIYLLQSLVMFAWSLFVFILLWQNKLLLYIAPRVEIWVKLGAAALYGLAAFQLYRGMRALSEPSAAQQHDCGCCSHHEASYSLQKPLLLCALFLLPLAVANALPATSLGSAMAEKKGVQYAASSERSSLAAPSPLAAGTKDGTDAADAAPDSDDDSFFLGADGKPIPIETVIVPRDKGRPDKSGTIDGKFKYDSYSKVYAEHASSLDKQAVIDIAEALFIETITTLDLYKQQFSGKKVNIRGFVHRGEGMNRNQFAVVRFSVECCAADAFPYGVVVETPQASRYANDTWIEVNGTLSTTTFDDAEIMKIEAEKIGSIAPAKEPYVYMDPDFYFGKRK
ncbi:TIGR03943 family putative permease subunit [Paenibacillus apiarius]|uniref:TIGR03943 family protein n=1 Tax=Paenibacillus apiarius TaxID=46240 RepID=A0ABT4DMC4_9BACL|nr:TIGR03943 family protein [Paenibacillus apiarius]MCY9516028.1 TIGR03943 family protein [Paenibacillus apiarius]MCY9518513.1 TIGR03943 family protein [Paenibacillus apiarius]MCY9551086.1 TIGR03943 family protein [Paenibacillus apiarius]MCY9558240.1 TIGR03943 family protein [Paenibacillus apiarius]MCY9684640.1 TIGR03943 family protein [Paenibacillus apiarius]